MTTKHYALINGFLLVAALVVTIRGITDTPPRSRYENENEVSAVHEAKDEQPSATDGSSIARPEIDSAKLAMLHEQTLFNPDRNEALELRGDEKGDAEKAPMDMELIGIGTVGEKSAAVILTRSNPARRGRPRDDETKRSKHVYMLGQPVEDTGYVIDRISMREVVLVKGDEERTLRLETTDETSENRKTAAAEHAREMAKNMERETAAEKAEKSPPPPPPPPPVPAQLQEALKIAQPPGTTGGGEAESSQQEQADAGADEREMSRRERIKRALEARRRILESRRNQEQ